MINFKNASNELPYMIFHKKYIQAEKANQKLIEAICISSFSHKNNEVDSRYVNLKTVSGRDLIFFSNYKSPKSEQFDNHNQVSIAIYWNSINVQIRIKAKVKRLTFEQNNEYFKTRSKEKNALAISSKQSQQINSYEDIKRKYNEVLKTENLEECPDYWGGYSLRPYSFEFWEGHEFRLNKRELFSLESNIWIKKILQP